jgi:hypothetical protein
MSKESMFAKLCGEILRLAISKPGAEISFEYPEPDRKSGQVALKQDERSPRRAAVVALEQTHVIAIAEVKLYRSWDVPASWIANAVGQAKALKRSFDVPSAYLMLSISVGELDQARIKRWADVDVIDRDGLYSYCVGRPDLFEALNSVLLGLTAEPPQAPPAPSSASVSWHDKAYSAEFSKQISQLRTRLEAGPKAAADYLYLEQTTISKEPEGARLCEALRNTKSGVRYYAAFERGVQEALEYVFNDQLEGWTRQPPTDDGLRMDIAAKIACRHDFWRELVRDFSTRFVLFECKNYAKRLSQEQVYTTEKYLFRKALRSVAILVSPHGPDGGAEAAIKGAIRESGKVILWITVEELCKMLHRKDTGDEVHEILASRLDNILLKIAR